MNARTGPWDTMYNQQQETAPVGVLAEREMLEPEEANLREATAPGKSCGSCVMFHPATGRCDLVLGPLVAGGARGPIEDDMVCDDWEAAEA